MKKDNNTNEELLKKFIGKNYDKITTKLFNINGFLFTSFYMYYCKMYLYGLIVFIIQLMLYIVLKEYCYLILIINLLIGFLVNKIYLIFVNVKINKINYNNQGKTYDEISKICEQCGGTNTISVVVGIIIETIIVVLINLLYFKVDFKKLVLKNKMPEVYIPGQYDGYYFYSGDVVIDDEFSISVPKEFENQSLPVEYIYEYNKDDNCIFTFGLVKDYTSSSDLINKMQIYHKLESENEMINGIEWNYLNYVNKVGKHYLYGTTKEKKVYLLEFIIKNNTLGHCEEFKNQVIDSINLKEKVEG